MYDYMTLFNAVTVFASWYAATYTATRYSHHIYSLLPHSFQSYFIHHTKLFDCRFAAHRGGAAERPENTLSAFIHAASLGCQLLELDVHLTKDKQVVVAHDYNTERISNTNVTIKHTNYNDLPRIKKTGLLLTPPFHSHGNTLDYIYESTDTISDKITDLASSAATNMNKYESDRQDNNNNISEHDTYRIPLLSEVFDRLPHCAVNIDLKDNDDELLYETHNVITQYKKQSSVAWGSSRDNTCQRCHELDPSIPLFFSGKQVLLLHIKYYLGILPFCHIKERMLGME